MKNALVLLMLSLATAVYGQEPSASEISTKITEYFQEDRTAFHVQTNKTVYFSGEEIWFSMYAFNRRTATLKKDNQNVVVQLRNSTGTLISSQLYLLDKGTQQGNILLEPALNAGIYTLSLTTAHPYDAFRKERFIQTLQVINPNSDAVVTSFEPSEMDVQVLPEGGHLVAEIPNSCGIKILNPHGKGVSIANMKLIDDQGNELLYAIKTNRLGMGKFRFVPEIGKQYFLALEAQVVPLPRANRFGISLTTLQNFKSGDLQIKLTANAATLEKIAHEQVSIVIHKDKSLQEYTVAFEPEYPEITFQIPNKNMYPGVNTVTVFNKQKEPLLERMFFNHKSIEKMTSFVSQTARKKDTFQYAIVNKVNQKSIRSITSISVLPAKTAALSNRESIYASVYLKPYLQGFVENPGYYFTRNNYQRQYEIDLLLLNQGWSRYEWHHVFKEKKDALRTTTELPGITLKGYVRAHTDRDIPTKVLLYSKDNENISVEPLDKESRFTFKGLAFTKGTELNFSALDRNGKPIMANFFYTTAPRTTEIVSENKTITPDFFTTNLRKPSLRLFLTDREQLDEVVISAEKLKYKAFFKGWDARKLNAKEKSRGNLRNFMATYGYYTIFDQTAGRRRFGRHVFTMNGQQQYFIEPAVVVDGMGYVALDIGEMISLQDVDEIYANKRGKAHTFVVYTNKKWAQNSDEKTSKKFMLKDGFTPTKEFYTPLYTTYASEEYQKYGVVSWHSKVTPNEQGYSQITVVNPGKNDLLFYTEGYSESGQPVASILKVSVDSGR